MQAKRAWGGRRRGNDKGIFLEKVSLYLSVPELELAEQRGEDAKYSIPSTGDSVREDGAA